MALPVLVAGVPIALGVFVASFALRRAARSGPPLRSVGAAVGLAVLVACVALGIAGSCVAVMVLSPS
jgi:F0F1-type ATP synthase membrane subunit c/vacuolar-type H+-ATPase subunit K